MKKGQCRNRQDMFAGNGEFAISIIDQSAPRLMCVDLEVAPSKTVLDDDFQNACHAEQKFVCEPFRTRFDDRAAPRLEDAVFKFALRLVASNAEQTRLSGGRS